MLAVMVYSKLQYNALVNVVTHRHHSPPEYETGSIPYILGS